MWSCVVSMVTLADTSWGACRPTSELRLPRPSKGTTRRSAPPRPPRGPVGVHGVVDAEAAILDGKDAAVPTCNVSTPLDQTMYILK